MALEIGSRLGHYNVTGLIGEGPLHGRCFMGIVHRASALVLVVSLSIIGIPPPAHAGGEESPPLTINGLPLSQVLNRRLSEIRFRWLVCWDKRPARSEAWWWVPKARC